MAGIGDLLRRAKLWQAIRILSACALSYGITTLLALPEGYWALITAVVVTQADLSSTVQAGRDRIFGTVIGAVMGALVIAANLEGGWPLPVLFWIALVPLAILTAIKPNLRLSCVTLVVVVLVPAASTWHRPLDRVIAILIGTLASIAVSAIIFPRKPTTPTPETVSDGSME
ncbi:aromatic acid exporter family protein [Beijerinckia sp. L45]|uniref:FUSC family protein n=1 Tax=Beijerinckia sp. L45 TaxID=1641855 RepID=UPI00131B4B77|nr:FUSC family protein [Beijerinckia sp. L45]